MLALLYGSVVALWVLQPVLAAVTFQGTLGPLGDVTECTSEIFDDDTLAGFLARETTNEATRNGNTFDYPVDLPCGEAYATAVAISCAGLGGQSTCTKGLLPRSRIMPRETTLGKRSAVFCKDASAECDDTINANALTYCPSGYARQRVEVRGSVTGYLCSKPCSPDQLDECLGSVCQSRRQQCSGSYSGYTALCGDALIKCRLDGPVSMKESICNDNLIPGSYPQNPCTGCVLYVNGQCNMNNTAYEAFQKRNKDAMIKLSYGLFNNPFGNNRWGNM